MPCPLACDLLHPRCGHGGLGHLLERFLDRSLHCRDHGALDEGCLAEHDPTRTIPQLFDSDLGAQHGAAQVDEHEDSGGTPHRLDGRADGEGVGPQPAVRASAHRRDLYFSLRHLLGEFPNTVGELLAVRDQDEANRAHARASLMPQARATREMGCSDRAPAPCSTCIRQVSQSASTTSLPACLTASKRRLPMRSESSYFSTLTPNVPEMPQHPSSTSSSCSPGIKRSSRTAGIPMP